MRNSSNDRSITRTMNHATQILLAPPPPPSCTGKRLCLSTRSQRPERRSIAVRPFVRPFISSLAAPLACCGVGAIYCFSFVRWRVLQQQQQRACPIIFVPCGSRERVSEGERSSTRERASLRPAAGDPSGRNCGNNGDILVGILHFLSAATVVAAAAGWKVGFRSASIWVNALAGWPTGRVKRCSSRLEG